MVVERRKITAATESLSINNVTINPKMEIHTNILGRVRILDTLGPVNKKRVTNEYYMLKRYGRANHQLITNM